MLALTAAATSTIRIGSGAVQIGHRTALSTVEEFGLIDALHPGRLDLGLGRSGGRPPRPQDRRGPRRPRARAVARPARAMPRRATGGRRTACSSRRSSIVAQLLGSPRFRDAEGAAAAPRRQSQDYGEQVGDVLALLRGTYRSPDGVQGRAVPGEGAQLQVWILGSSGGQSAEVGGSNGLRFAANYHVSPATVLEAVDGYRAAFRPSADLDRPYVSVSADVVVAEDEATARELATGYGLWVRSIRSGEGAIEFPTPQEARAHAWTDDDRELVADRVRHPVRRLRRARSPTSSSSFRTRPAPTS